MSFGVNLNLCCAEKSRKSHYQVFVQKCVLHLRLLILHLIPKLVNFLPHLSKMISILHTQVSTIPFLLPPWSTGHHGIGQASLSVIKSTTIFIIKTSRLAISKLATLLASSSFSSLCSLIFYSHENRIITITGHRFNTKSIRSSVTGFSLREFLEQLPPTLFWNFFST